MGKRKGNNVKHSGVNLSKAARDLANNKSTSAQRRRASQILLEHKEKYH